MGKRVLAGLAAGLCGIALTTGAYAQAGGPPVTRGPGPVAAPAPPRASAPHAAWGRRVDGRWSAGWNAPGGWNGYYRPVAGWSLPDYWINPDFYIADWRGYGLPAPAAGYGWSRYYDDAVLTDRYGRVSDVRYGWDWDRYGGYDDGYYGPERRERTGNTVAGAVAGGVIGGIAGNVIAGRGDKLAGTLVGAGVGAIAGGVIGDASTRHKRPKRYRGRDYPDAPLAYDGQWQGTWLGRDGSAYSGTYDGRWQGDVSGAYQGYAVPAPLPYPPAPAYGYGYDYGYGYGASSYYSAVDYVAPTVVTETVVTEETTYAATRNARRAVVHKARPRARVVCCRCGC